MSYLVVENLMEMPFSFRVKMGRQEIEISGTREEVIKTIEELPSLVASISKAFESTENMRTASKSVTSTYPSISSSPSVPQHREHCAKGALARLLPRDP